MWFEKSRLLVQGAAARFSCLSPELREPVAFNEGTACVVSGVALVFKI